MNASALAAFKCIVAAQIEAMGMQAENQQRAACGNSMAYTMEDFARVANFMDETFREHINWVNQ